MINLGVADQLRGHTVDDSAIECRVPSRDRRSAIAVDADHRLHGTAGVNDESCVGHRIGDRRIALAVVEQPPTARAGHGRHRQGVQCAVAIGFRGGAVDARRPVEYAMHLLAGIARAVARNALAASTSS